MRVRSLRGPALGFAAGVVLVPAVAMAATGSFTSNTSATALTVANTGTGRALTSVSASSSGSVFQASGDTPGAGLFSRSTSEADDSKGLFGVESAPTGATYGVVGTVFSADGTGLEGRAVSPDGGIGVRGLGGDAGVVGFGDPAFDGVGVAGGSVDFSTGQFGTPGDGSFGVFSFVDTYTDGHMVTADDQMAGDCTVAANAVAGTCPFADAFPAGTAPQVVVTPQGNPGSFFWVTTTATELTVHLAAGTAAAVPFSYVVVGTVPAGTAIAGHLPTQSELRRGVPARR